jgi:hypothetical protein
VQRTAGRRDLALFVYAAIGMPATAMSLRLLLVAPAGTHTDRLVDADVQDGIPCSAVADDGGIHVVYRKLGDGLYHQRILP